MWSPPGETAKLVGRRRRPHHTSLGAHRPKSGNASTISEGPRGPRRGTRAARWPVALCPPGTDPSNRGGVCTRARPVPRLRHAAQPGASRLMETRVPAVGRPGHFPIRQVGGAPRFRADRGRPLARRPTRRAANPPFPKSSVHGKPPARGLDLALHTRKSTGSRSVHGAIYTQRAARQSALSGGISSVDSILALRFDVRVEGSH